MINTLTKGEKIEHVYLIIITHFESDDKNDLL